MDGRNVIYVDVDGVMVNPTAGFLTRLNRTARTHYKLADITAFNYRDCLPKEHAIAIEEMWANPTLYDSMKPDAGVVTAIRKMRRFARVVALSTPTIGHSDSKLRFLVRPPLSFAKKDIVILFDKSLMRGVSLIDDNIDNLLNFSGERICFARKWNEAWDKQLGLRTNRWSAIVEKVREAVSLVPDEEEEE
jgi:5'(3')-deoxyribonucleotidase